MAVAVEELGELESATCLAGLAPGQYFDDVVERVGELGAAVEEVGPAGNMRACVVACTNDVAAEVALVLPDRVAVVFAAAGTHQSDVLGVPAAPDMLDSRDGHDVASSH